MLSFTVGTTKIQIYTSFVLLMILMIALGNLEQFFILFLAVSLHECSHVAVAGSFGLRAERLVITPVGELAVIQGLEFLPYYQRFLIISAGPITNLALYGAGLLLLPDGSFRHFFCSANLSIALFNLLPAYPLDGGRLLRFLLANPMGVIPANRMIMKISAFLSWALICLGFVQVILYPFNISLLCIGFYLGQVGKKEYVFMTYEFYRSIIASDSKIKNARERPVKPLMVSAQADIQTLLYRLCWDYVYVFYITGNGAEYTVVTEQALLAYVMTHGLHGQAEALVTK